MGEKNSFLVLHFLIKILSQYILFILAFAVEEIYMK